MEKMSIKKKPHIYVFAICTCARAGAGEIGRCARTVRAWPTHPPSAVHPRARRAVDVCEVEDDEDVKKEEQVDEPIDEKEDGDARTLFDERDLVRGDDGGV